MKLHIRFSLSIVSLLVVTVIAISFFTVSSATRSMLARTEQNGEAVSQARDRSSSASEAVVAAARRLTDDEVLALARAAAAECARALERAIDQGAKSEEDIFSTLYFPIVPLTSPRTYSTLYDEYADRVITPIEDTYLEKDPSIVFVVLVDRNGYLPSHNSKFSQPRTGNLELDLKSNRTKRIFNDITGFRAAKNQEDFLLQVYRRDTGETMKDLSVPVFVKGKHWGALRIGYLGE